MSALILFSGGIDSAVLAADIAYSPSRYNIDKNEKLTLLTWAPKSGSSMKARLLKPLRLFLAQGVLEIDWVIRECPLLDAEPKPLGEGGHQTAYPLISEYSPDRDSAPYTPGLHLWLASLAVNVLADQPLPVYGPRKAFWGFQEDGPVWEAQEAGKVPSYDASEGWVKALNVLMGEGPTKVRFRAPFLESRVDKVKIVQMGQSLALPFEHTSSCMYGWNTQGCGQCHQCVRRARVFRALGVEVLCLP